MGLKKVKKTVNRGGKTHTQTYYVSDGNDAPTTGAKLPGGVPSGLPAPDSAEGVAQFDQAVANWEKIKEKIKASDFYSEVTGQHVHLAEPLVPFKSPEPKNMAKPDWDSLPEGIARPWRTQTMDGRPKTVLLAHNQSQMDELVSRVTEEDGAVSLMLRGEQNDSSLGMKTRRTDFKVNNMPPGSTLEVGEGARVQATGNNLTIHTSGDGHVVVVGNEATVTATGNSRVTADFSYIEARDDALVTATRSHVFLEGKANAMLDRSCTWEIAGKDAYVLVEGQVVRESKME